MTGLITNGAILPLPPPPARPPADGGNFTREEISLQKNQLDELISQIYFRNRTLHVSDSFSVRHQQSSTVHTAIGIGYADCLLASSQHNLYDIYLLLCVQH